MTTTRIPPLLISAWHAGHGRSLSPMVIAYRFGRAARKAWKLMRRADRAAERGRLVRAVHLGKRAEAAFLRAYVLASRARA